MSNRRGSRRDGTNKNRNEYNAERVNRWRRHAERCEANIGRYPIYDNARLIAAIEGKPLSDIVVDVLCRQRLRGKVVRQFKCNRRFRQAFNAYKDTLIEECGSIKRRNNHEAELVSFTILHINDSDKGFFRELTAQERNEFIRRFYVKGDLTAHKAILRAIRFAVGGTV